MSINISYLAGAGAQFFDRNGAPLSGGLLYTYDAGTTTPVSTYTSRSGAAFNTNPIVLDASGRTPAEIWLEGGVLYKFVLKDSTFVQIGSYDNIPAVNDPTTTNNLITVAGTNALTGLAIPPLEGYTAGAQYSFIAQNTNTGAVTLDIDSLGVKAVTKFGATALSAGDIVGGAMTLVEYDGTRFQLLNPANSVFDNITVDYIKETTTVSATAATGTVNYDVATQSILYYTTNASANWTVNFRGGASTSLNSLMSTGQTITVTFMVTQGATAYYNSAVTIDGSAVTPKWQNGIAPTAGNINAIDSYTYAIVKTASATFTVLASIVKFA
jgi:hypothetical protein